MDARKKYIEWVSLIAGTVLMLFSCRHKDLCYEEAPVSQVEVAFDWSKAPQAKVASMRVFLYPEDGGKVMTYEFANMQGGPVMLPEGNYRAICINSDTEALLYKNIHTYEEFMVSTPVGLVNGMVFSALQMKKKAVAYSVQTSPDDFYSDNLSSVHIRSASGKQRIVFYPEMAFCRYRIKMINVINLQHVYLGSVTGGLSGLSEVFYVGRNVIDNDRAIVPFNMKRRGDSTLTASFFALGQSKYDDEHKVAIHVRLQDGSEKCYVFDVTQQIHEAPDPRNVLILLDGMVIPDTLDYEHEEKNEGGFKPSLDDWEDVNVDLDM